VWYIQRAWPYLTTDESRNDRLERSRERWKPEERRCRFNGEAAIGGLLTGVIGVPIGKDAHPLRAFTNALRDEVI